MHGAGKLSIVFNVVENDLLNVNLSFPVNNLSPKQIANFTTLALFNPVFSLLRFLLRFWLYNFSASSSPETNIINRDLCNELLEYWSVSIIRFICKSLLNGRIES